MSQDDGASQRCQDNVSSSWRILHNLLEDLWPYLQVRTELCYLHVSKRASVSCCQFRDRLLLAALYSRSTCARCCVMM